MATSVTLADLQAAAQERWGDFRIEDIDVTLRHALRLSEADRKKLADLFEEHTSSDEDDDDPDGSKLLGRMRAIVEIVAEDKAQAKRLLDAFGGDATLIVVLVEQYMEATQLGEASDSEN